MKLISSLTTPFGRKVRIVLLEKKIPHTLEVDIPWKTDTKVPEYNPLGKVPVLVLKDGQTLFDSRVIVEYLDHVSPVSQLIPQDPAWKIYARKIEALADGITEAAAAVYLEKRRSMERQDPDWIARQQGKIFRGLEALAEELGENANFIENRLSLPDIAVGCMLGYLDFRFPQISWREAHPNLVKLAEKLNARTSFQETVPVAS